MTRKEVRTVKCPICGKILGFQDMTERPEIDKVVVNYGGKRVGEYTIKELESIMPDTVICRFCHNEVKIPKLPHKPTEQR